MMVATLLGFVGMQNIVISAIDLRGLKRAIGTY